MGVRTAVAAAVLAAGAVLGGAGVAAGDPAPFNTVADPDPDSGAVFANEGLLAYPEGTGSAAEEDASGSITSDAAATSEVADFHVNGVADDSSAQ
ncbi:hypothetical protein ACH4GM_40885 [Streptomyces coeruleorubidus]|uniref:hypothetical protein n=1 Tax=Streptomyces coeruleorubidus TaxID=116188 RepID=UPI0037B8614A